jgi:2-oxoglutarate dehydrogenase complex dehydrogenase (E1) component-like enzyme
VSRRAAASPAVGSTQVHETQQREVLATAFN